MTYAPQKQNHTAEWLSLTLMLAAATSYLLSRMDSSIRWILQAFSLIILIAGLQFLIRYSMTSFLYTLDGDDLIITKLVGRRKQVYCDLTLKLAVSLSERKSGGQTEQSAVKLAQQYNCCVTLMPQKSYVFLFRVAEKTSAITFEPDEAFVLEMRKRINMAKAAAPEEE